MTDSEAWTVVPRADYGCSARRFALAWTNDRGAAEDLAQESYIRLWDTRTSVDWDRSLLAWRTAIVLTALEGYAYADAAEALGTSAGALRAAVSRARDKLEEA